MAFVYLLRCGDGSLYCGWTVDLAARVAAHGAGRGARYTRSRGPVELAAAWETPDHTTARSLEGRIKRLERREKDALVAGAALDGGTRLELADGAEAAAVRTPSSAPAGTRPARPAAAADRRPSRASSR
jgi:putative endonuclease